MPFPVFTHTQRGWHYSNLRGLF